MDIDFSGHQEWYFWLCFYILATLRVYFLHEIIDLDAWELNLILKGGSMEVSWK